MNNPSHQTETAPTDRLFTRGWILFFICALVLIGGWSLGRAVDWAAASRCWDDFTSWSCIYFAFPNEDNSHSWILCPALFTIVLAGTVRLLWDRPPDWLRLPVGLGFLILQIAYLGFRLIATLSLENVPNAIVSILFFLSELFI